MDHLAHYQRRPAGDEDNDAQPSSYQPRGRGHPVHQVPGNTQSTWDPQYPRVPDPSNMASPLNQGNEQYHPQQNPQYGSSAGYGPPYAALPTQGEDLSLSHQYGTNYVPFNYGNQGRGLPCRTLVPPNRETNLPPQHQQHGPQRPRSITTATTHLTHHSYNSAGSGLDQSYVMKGTSYFIPGTVFLCLWTEPLGETTTQSPNAKDRISPVCFGQSAYSNIIRFVVILSPEGEQFSVCCPIKTYGHRGTAKNQSAHSHHSMIYATGSQPKKVQGEADFTKRPIEMKPADNKHTLNTESRLNFAKPTSVEHNIRVKHLGKIIPEHLRRLFRSYREENGNDAIREAEEMAMGAPRQRETGPRNTQAEVFDYEEDDEDDNGGDDNVGVEGRCQGRGQGNYGEPEFAQGLEIRGASGRRRSRAEPPHVDNSSYTQAHRGRSNTGMTSRSSPVPSGSQKEIGRSPRRKTQPQTEAILPDSSLQKYSKDRHRREDGRYGSYR